MKAHDLYLYTVRRALRQSPRLFKQLQFLVSSGSIVQLWPLDETSGTTATEYVNGYTGTYQGTFTLNDTGLGDGQGAFSENGAGRVNIYSTALAAAMPTQELTISLWAKVASGGIWNDGTIRYMFIYAADGSNTMWIRKGTAANQLQFAYVAGGVTSLVAPTYSGIDLEHFAITVSKSGDQFKAYARGAQILSTISGVGVWAGSIASTLATIGASSNSSFSQSWKGTETLLRVDNRALSPLEIAQLAQCNGFIVFDGDSRSVGGANPYPQQTMSGIYPLKYGFYNSGISGQTIANMNADIVQEARPYWTPQWRNTNYAILFGGVNDVVGGADVNTIWERMKTWATLVSQLGFKPIICTEIDGQNTALNAANYHTVIWPALNTLIRNNWQPYFYAMIDFGADARMQDATNTIFFSPDRVHLNTTGYGVLGSIAADKLKQL